MVCVVHSFFGSVFMSSYTCGCGIVYGSPHPQLQHQHYSRFNALFERLGFRMRGCEA
jgi:hypothetical protein